MKYPRSKGGGAHWNKGGRAPWNKGGGAPTYHNGATASAALSDVYFLNSLSCFPKVTLVIVSYVVEDDTTHCYTDLHSEIHPNFWRKMF